MIYFEFHFAPVLLLYFSSFLLFGAFSQICSCKAHYWHYRICTYLCMHSSFFLKISTWEPQKRELKNQKILTTLPDFQFDLFTFREIAGIRNVKILLAFYHNQAFVLHRLGHTKGTILRVKYMSGQA